MDKDDKDLVAEVLASEYMNGVIKTGMGILLIMGFAIGVLFSVLALAFR